MVEPSETVMMSRIPCNRATTSTDLRSMLLVRENVKSCPVSLAPRSVARFAVAAIVRTRSSTLTRAISSALTMITLSRLLKSCAIPPVSCPNASIFCDCTSTACTLARS